ncbi:MAG: cell division protein ZipA C-terminal FtsZ-binding domain-containing protein [Gammaproteobacteria bacterium]|nr:cell division protein ZipA C-terminal FtsZ-binding domain-containing protein [Gammaproteobacteria bacterium]
MIELRTALLLAGILLFVIILVVSYDKIRVAKRTPGRVREHERDWEEPVLTPQQVDVEPSVPRESEGIILSPQEEDLDGAEEEITEELDVANPESGQAHEPLYTDDLPPDQAETAAMGDAEPEPDEGRQIEFVARLPGKNIIKRDTALGIYRQYEYELSKPHRIFGLAYPDQNWCDLEHESDSARFTHFGLSLQLADRHGPLTESELNQFSQMVLRFSEVFGRRFKFSMGFEDALNEALVLDELSKKYDALAILNILSRDPRGFPGTEIDLAARELGMELSSARNIYYKKRPHGRGNRHLYSLASLFGSGEFDVNDLGRFRTNGVMLFINIPSTLNPGQVFKEMVEDAKGLCKRIDGKLVDQHKRGMTEKGLKRIAQQIRDIASEMEKEGIPPGSDQAVRLF